MKKVQAGLYALTICLCILSAGPISGVSYAQTCNEWASKVVSVQGVVHIRRAGETRWIVTRLNDVYCPGDMIRVEENSRAAVLLPNEAVLRIDQKTTLTFTRVEEKQTSLIDLLKGVVHFFSRKYRGLKVATPFVNGTVEGTEFLVKVEEGRTLFLVFEGKVAATNARGSLVLAGGQSAEALAGQAPQSFSVTRPKQAVQWALYYPPVIDYRPENFSEGADTDWQRIVQKSLRLYWEGDLSGAFSSLADAPNNIHDVRFFTYRAALLLSVGRVEEARDDIQKVFAIDPSNSHAFALQSIIAVVQNEKEHALDLAGKAVASNPQSSAARVALSYAQQTGFDVKGALDSLKEAVKLDPTNPLAWARLAELWQALGYLDKSVETAKEAVSLNPSLERAQTVLGFAYLTQIKIKDSITVFEKAIFLDSASPLARLGLGLAKIRNGDLREGRLDIEIAASLDPNNSLIRSYLGKAYYEEKRDKLAGDQYELAKKLDPNDPTPWFYDAIRKQTTNRPVEALQDLQKSIELNDNRAMYRSRLLLDEDLAARSASLGRIYQDLRFEQLALVEGWKSVNTDPSNYSAHRFLADSYAALPRHEIARVSELLQSQLLQPININPVHPSLSESNLFTLEGAGPSDPSFNEFNPLFNRNRLALQAGGVVGDNDTRGGEIAQSGVWGRASYSVGGFKYKTDGFRKNNDQEQELYNVFSQINPWHNTSFLGEYRSTDSKFGDLPFRFDPELFYPDDKHHEKAESIRLGMRQSFSPRSDFIATIIFKDNEALFENPPAGFGIKVEDEGTMAEVQHLFRSGSIGLISGLSFLQSDRKQTFTFPPFTSEDNVSDKSAYVYSQINIPKNFTWTVGASANFFDGIVDKNRFNPKMGVVWNPNPSTTLRAAAFRALTKNLISDQTIEPTQVAGFNQFFADLEGSEAWRYGAAIEQKFPQNFFGGIEFSKRDLDVPFVGPTMEVKEADWQEKFARAYLYWTPKNWLSVSAEYQWERFERDLKFTSEEQIHILKTHKLPLGLNFYLPLGVTAKFKATYVNQEGEFDSMPRSFVTEGGRDHFWVMDVSLSYRLPKRYGVISVEANNLFDKQFYFQNMDRAGPEIYPERFILVKMTLSF